MPATDQSATTVVIVDDEPALLRMMSAYLTRRGFAVLTFSSTDKALAHIDADPASVAVALLDISMPGLSPLELGRRLLAANPQARVIMASGYPGNLTELEAFAPGRVAFLHKPFTPESLAGSVRSIVAGDVGGHAAG
jgi:two-component system, cell cycle sensor histidine kinase and response regulator CckA